MNSSLFTPRRILLAVAVIALIFLLRECFKKRDDTGTAPDQLSIRLDGAASNINPYLTVLGSDIYICSRVFQTFADMDPKSLELVPLMIKQIPQSRKVEGGPHNGELAYDFEILPEAKWDNGTDITGNDFIFTLKLIYHPLLASKAYMGYFKDLSGVDIDPKDPKKFTVYFRQYYILALESMCQIAIMPGYNYDANNRLTNTPLADFLDTAKVRAMETDPGFKAFDEEFRQPKFTNDPNFVVGSGAYKLETMNDQGVILVKKANWLGDKMAVKNPLLAAYPKKLIYKAIKDENIIENMLKNGELDIVSGSISPDKFIAMKAKDSLASRYDFIDMPPFQYNRWLFNLTNPKLNDLRVRKALAHIIDYGYLQNKVRAGMATRTVSPILPAKKYYAKDLPLFDFNVEKAKSLLTEAGWSDSDGDGVLDKTENGQKVKFSLEVLVPISKTNQMYAESIVETARLAGIEIKAVPLDIMEISKRSKSGDYESALMGSMLFPGLTDLSQRYHSKYLSPAGDNRARYVNTQLDVLLERIAAESDEVKRNQLYLEAQKIIYDDQPETFILAPYQLVITAKKFEAVTSTNRPGYYEHLFKLKAAN